MPNNPEEATESLINQEPLKDEENRSRTTAGSGGEDSNFGRRDLLKFGGLTALGLPLFTRPAKSRQGNELGKIERKFGFGNLEDLTHEWNLVDVRSRTPVILAAIQTSNGTDTANVRISSERADSGPLAGLVFLSMKIEEERSADDETRHTEEVVGYTTFEPGRIEDWYGNEIGYADILEVDQPDGDTWRPLEIPSPFSVDISVAFMQVLSFNGPQPVHPRIATSHPETGEAGFHFKMEEWPTYDQRHVREQLGYVVLNRGSHTIGSPGMLIPTLEVDTTDPLNYISDEDSWQHVQLNEPFLEGSVVVTQCQTFNGSDPVVTRQSMLDSNEFQVRLQEAESQGNHQALENVGYVGIGDVLG